MSDWKPISEFDRAKAKAEKQIVFLAAGVDSRIFVANYTGGGDPYEPGPWRVFKVAELGEIPPPPWEDGMWKIAAELRDAITKEGKWTSSLEAKVADWLPRAKAQWEAKPKAPSPTPSPPASPSPGPIAAPTSPTPPSSPPAPVPSPPQSPPSQAPSPSTTAPSPPPAR